MHNLWFDSYSRKNGPPDSSAFEHVFMGELENQEVHGLHNWIRLAYLESIGALKYSGFVIQRKVKAHQTLHMSVTVDFRIQQQAFDLNGMAKPSTLEQCYLDPVQN
ncbi:placental protein 11 [Trichinella spiralis]|uniref:placental protein 11 n=1 Tax=Trichinella spiralis TaxID=6334 RepID=UPI0001EFD02D|nr:placental protein 11 [Trichinella spiralis]